jgi:hypothetical protein
LSAYCQDGWKPFLLDWQRPGDSQVPITGNHPLVRNTCVYWSGQGTGLCSWGGTVGG